MKEVPKLYRVILQASDLERASEFYSKLLRVKGRLVHSSRLYFDCGAVILALVDPRGDGQRARPNPDHVYFSVKDLEAVHARAKKLKCLAKGNVHGSPAGEIVERPWGEFSFYAVDPFGNPLCFVEERSVFTGR